MTRNGRTSKGSGVATLGVCLIAAGGCSLDGPTRRSPSSTPHRFSEAPREVEPLEGAEPVQVLLVRGTPTDSDSDGFPDTIPALVYLFPDSTESAMSVWAEGEFEFRLLDREQRLVANWVFPADVTADSRRMLQPGPAYSFFLRLGGDDDRMAPARLDLSAVFRASNGRRVSSQGSAAVRLGASPGTP